MTGVKLEDVILNLTTFDGTIVSDKSNESVADTIKRFTTNPIRIYVQTHNITENAPPVTKRKETENPPSDEEVLDADIEDMIPTVPRRSVQTRNTDSDPSILQLPNPNNELAVRPIAQAPDTQHHGLDPDPVSPQLECSDTQTYQLGTATAISLGEVQIYIVYLVQFYPLYFNI